MSETKGKLTQKDVDTELLLLEQRKAKALEKIANSLDALTVWFEEINKDEWSARAQYYLSEFHTKFVKGKDTSKDDES
jgi:hypothetical protein